MSHIDLHVHTKESDGSFSPAQIVQMAKDVGLSAIAITDHDTVAGIDPALAVGKEIGIEVVPGIELSTKFRSSVHVLGYYVDGKNAELNAKLKELVKDRDARNLKIVSRMQEDGISITYKEMKARFGDVVVRPHFAQILMENGIAASPAEAFQHFLCKDGRYWFPRHTISLEESVQMIRDAGGTAVLAHPFEYRFDKNTISELITAAIGAGIEGIECRHSSHTPEQMKILESLADEYGLFKTGGSDFHGKAKPDVFLGIGKGQVSVPYEWLAELKQYRREHNEQRI